MSPEQSAEVPEPSAEVVGHIAEVARLMLADVEQLGRELDAAEIAFTPELGADAAIMAEVSASNRANVNRLLTVLAEGQVAPLRADIPAEALDIVRTIVRRGIDLDVIFHAYRRGQNLAWRHWMGYAERVVSSGPELIQLLRVSAEVMFDFVDQLISQVITEAQREREEVLGGALARRTETVRLILDGAPVDQGGAGRRLGYQLDRRHTALVLWADAGQEITHGALESAATLLARAAGGQLPLVLPAGTTTLWAWFGSRAEPDPDALREAAARAEPGIRVAVGPTREGITGFRRSHAAALDMHRLLIGNPAGERVALHRDLEVTALVARDRAGAAEFVAATLGPLGADTATAHRLRETLRVYLDEADNAPRAADRLHTHRNTVLQRVARATELLGYRPADRRLPLRLALELTHHLGPTP
jgi:DNA-binding PucR family transcriptional regulator